MEPEAPLPSANKPLPAGWETAVSPVDGRVYYYNSSTGATSWMHPNVSAGNTSVPPPQTGGINSAPSLGEYSGILANRSSFMVEEKKSVEVKKPKESPAEVDNLEAGLYTKMTDYDPTQPINSHRCYAIVAMILFFPLGVVALTRSLATVSKYRNQRYEAAHDCSHAALLFSRIACITGITFWSYFFYCYFAGPGAPFAFIEIPAEWVPEIHYNW